MNNKIGIRLEDKNKWETRTPIIPNHVKDLVEKESLDLIVQKSPIRSFPDSEYEIAGARIANDLSDANIIFAIKEIPIPLLESNKTYLFFSHTIKGQRQNMPMLKKILDLKATLIDYEKIVNEKGFRLIFFGNYAGLAGMNQTLWGYGQRVKASLGIDTPFLKLKHTYQYSGLDELKSAVSEVGKDISENGLPRVLVPLVVGFAGYGNVSKGAQSVLDLLPVIEIEPPELSDFFIFKEDEFSSNHVYKVVFKEEHMVKRVEGEFDLQDYYKHGLEKYAGVFEEYIQYLSILMNGIFWSEKYPRLLSKKHAKDMFESKIEVRLQVIGDISCDVEGGIEPTLMVTEPDNPIFIYNPFTEETSKGFEGEGLAIMAVDNLPCELPLESSTNFSTTLIPFIPEIAQADYSKPFSDLNLSPVIKNAVITHQGELTPSYSYLQEYLDEI
ncbi:MAG: bifunctional lysine ketoglutarate reductase /saccharopine dehydrogenase family protein [Candidatus Hodarchaeales archaeon]|jgi:alpha-aminoadipic semialdehyde synthase